MMGNLPEYVCCRYSNSHEAHAHAEEASLLPPATHSHLSSSATEAVIKSTSFSLLHQVEIVDQSLDLATTLSYTR